MPVEVNLNSTAQILSSLVSFTLLCMSVAYFKPNVSLSYLITFKFSLLILHHLNSDINMSNQDLAASYSEKHHDYERNNDNRGTVEYDLDATMDDSDLDWAYDLDDIEADSAGNLSSESDLASGYDGGSDSDELEELYDVAAPAAESIAEPTARVQHFP